MENKYELITNLSYEMKKIYEKYFTSEGYEIVVNEDRMIFAKKINDNNIDLKKERAIINVVYAIVKRDTTKGILYMDLSREMNWIMKHTGDSECVDFRQNNVTWAIRQAILKAKLKREDI